MVPKHQPAQGLVFRSGHGFCSSIHWGAAEGISSPAEVSIGSLFGTGKSWKSTRKPSDFCIKNPDLDRFTLWRKSHLHMEKASAFPSIYTIWQKKNILFRTSWSSKYTSIELNRDWTLHDACIYDKEKQCLSNYTSFPQRGGTSPNFVHAPQMRTHPINGDQWISAHSHNHGSKSFRYFQQVAI